MSIQCCNYWLIAVVRIVILAIEDTGTVEFGFGAISDGVAVAIYCLFYNIVIFFLFICLFACVFA